MLHRRNQEREPYNLTQSDIFSFLFVKIALIKFCQYIFSHIDFELMFLCQTTGWNFNHLVIIRKLYSNNGALQTLIRIEALTCEKR